MDPFNSSQMTSLTFMFLPYIYIYIYIDNQILELDPYNLAARFSTCYFTGAVAKQRDVSSPCGVTFSDLKLHSAMKESN